MRSFTNRTATYPEAVEIMARELEYLDAYDSHRSQLQQREMKRLQRTDDEWEAYKMEFEAFAEFLTVRTLDTAIYGYSHMASYLERYDAFKNSLHSAGRITRSALVFLCVFQISLSVLLVLVVVGAVCVATREARTSKQVTQSTKALVDNLGVPAFIVDDNSFIVDVSYAALEPFGYDSKQDVLGRRLDELLVGGGTNIANNVPTATATKLWTWPVFSSPRPSDESTTTNNFLRTTEDPMILVSSSESSSSTTKDDDRDDDDDDDDIEEGSSAAAAAKKHGCSTTSSSHEIIRGVTKDGRPLDLVGTATRTVHCSEKGKQTTTIVCQDVTELLSKDRDLQVAQKVLRQFAHELRSKYGCALNELEAVRAWLTDDKDHERGAELQKVGVTDESLSSAMTLLYEGDQLIETRLQLHKVYRGVYETLPNVQVVDQQTLLGSRVDVAKALASSSHNVTYDVATPPDLATASLKLDCYVFAHVANNLLSNARKFTASGTVTLSFLGEVASSDDDDDDDDKQKTMLLFAVKDTGNVIPDGIKVRLFKEEVASSDVRGTGLGLLSCKVFAEAIGGSCWLENTRTYLETDPDHASGTEFRFALPGGIVDATTKIITPPSEDDMSCIPAKLRAFVVEDSAMLRRCISAKLKAVAKTAGTDIEITEHETVESIIPTISSFSGDPDVIVTADQNLDSMGGVLKGSHLITALKNSGFNGLLVSCSGDLDVAQEHLRLGADLVWGKPLPNTGVVLSSLRRYYVARSHLNLDSSSSSKSSNNNNNV